MGWSPDYPVVAVVVVVVTVAAVVVEERTHRIATVGLTIPPLQSVVTCEPQLSNTNSANSGSFRRLIPSPARDPPIRT